MLCVTIGVPNKLKNGDELPKRNPKAEVQERLNMREAEVRERLKLSGMSDLELANISGVSRRTARYFLGGVPVTPRILRKLSAA